MIKKIILSTVLGIAGVLPAVSETVRYGYSPEVVAEEDMRAQGSGSNNFIAGMICLDPEADPVVADLKGHEILGVRCYMKSAYAQAKQNRSKIMHASGSPSESVVSKVCDFAEGWNEIYFDEPLTIGDEKVFVGIQVYELRGTPYPLICFGSASVAGGCWINMNFEGWQEYTDRGTLMIQAILDDAATEKVDNIGRARVEDAPLAIAPAEMFDTKIFVGNYSSESVSRLTLETIGQGDTEAHLQEITFDTPLAPREGRMIDARIRAGSETGKNQWLKLRVTEMNGNPTNETAAETTYHYVTVDAFNRIPIVEEFTSQYCVNCPFMFYYLEQAMEMYDGEVIYLSRHSGYADDYFSQPCDAELVYLFNSEYGFNPAVMYDRYLLDGETCPPVGATLAEPDPYLEQIRAAALRPAKASVEITMNYDESTGIIKPSVEGRIGSEIFAADEPVYLSIYLVEDGIKVEDRRTFQYGLDDETAPADLKDKFRHNGVIRHDFCSDPKGFLLEPDADANYRIDCSEITLDANWVKENCRIVALVHKRNETDMSDNYVLNANHQRLVPSGVKTVMTEQIPNVKVNHWGEIEVSANVEDYTIYAVDGSKVADSRLPSGIYIVRCKMIDGNSASLKIRVK